LGFKAKILVAMPATGACYRGCYGHSKPGFEIKFKIRDHLIRDHRIRDHRIRD